MPRVSSDAATSEATSSSVCARSGSFALLLTVVLGLLAAPWSQRESEKSFSRYTGLRMDLSLQIQGLDDDPYWEMLMVSNKAADMIPLKQLLVTRVPLVLGSSSASSDSHNAQPRRSKPSKSIANGGVPSPPTSLTITDYLLIAEVPRIVDSLKGLNNSTLLTESRLYSNYYNLSIARWDQKLIYLMFRNVVNHRCSPTKPLEVSFKGKPSGPFVPELDHDVLLECLTIQDVRQLAEFQQPVVSNPDQVGAQIERQVDVTLGSLPRNLVAATVAVHIFLCFVIVYFAVFAGDAVASPSFPAAGTLFGVFSRSRLTLGILFLAIWSPLVASVAVIISSHQPWIGVFSVLVFLALLYVHRMLGGKLYFSRLRSVRSWASRRRTHG